MPQHSRHSKRRRQDWEFGGRRIDCPPRCDGCFFSFLSLCHRVLCRKREMNATLEAFFSCFSCRQKAGRLARAGQSNCVISAFLSIPPHPVLQHTFCGRARGNNAISLLHYPPSSLKARFNATLHPRIYIQIRERMWIVISACPHHHPPPPCACMSVVICQIFPLLFFKKPWECQIRKATRFAEGC